MIRLRAAERFSEPVCRLVTTEEKRFWMAPRSARDALTASRAASIARIMRSADSAVRTVSFAKPLVSPPMTSAAAAVVAARPLDAAPALATVISTSTVESRTTPSPSSFNLAVTPEIPASLIAVIKRAACSAPVAPAADSASVTFLPLITRSPVPIWAKVAGEVVSVIALPATETNALSGAFQVPSSAVSALAMPLTVMVWPWSAPIWKTASVKDPSSRLVPLKLVCSATR